VLPGLALRLTPLPQLHGQTQTHQNNCQLAVLLLLLKD
jgi:hypothetical protein